jgi:hypothetical protein
MDGVVIFGFPPLFIVLFDIVACLIARRWSIEYGGFRFGSYLTYLIIGFVGGFIGGWVLGAEVAAITGLTESTVGWAISWYMGPGRWKHGPPTRTQVVQVVLLVTGMATAL